MKTADRKKLKKLISKKMFKQSLQSKTIFLLLLFIIMNLFFSCSKTFDNIEEYEKYIRSPEYPYYQEIIKNGVKVSLRYMPTDAMMINRYKNYFKKIEEIENETTNAPDETGSALRADKIKELKQEIEEEKAMYDRSLYFYLTIGYEDEKKDIVFESMQAGFSNYSEWLQILLFHLKEYIYLKTAKIDEILIDTYQMDRTYGMTKYRKILLVFPNEFNDQHILNEDQEYLKLIIKEFGLKTGKLKIEFELPIEKVEFKL